MNQPPQVQVVPKVRIHVSATDLEKEKSDDPLCMLYVKNGIHNRWDIVGSTEYLKNNLDPQWMSTFLVSYNPQIQQILKFVVLMHRSEIIGNRDVEYGELEIDLGTLLSNPKKNKFTLVSKSQPVIGTLIIGFEMDNDKDPNNSMVVCQIDMKKSEKLHWYRKNKIFFEISRPTPYCDDYFVIYRSSLTKDDFQPFIIQSKRLSANTDDPKFPLRITFYDNNLLSKLVNLGSYNTSFENIHASLKKPISICGTNEDGKIVESTFSFDSIKILKYTPYDILRSHGLDLNLAAFVDMDVHLKPRTIDDDSIMESSIYQALSGVLETLTHFFTNQVFQAYRMSYQTRSNEDNNPIFVMPSPLLSSGPNVTGINGVTEAYIRSAYQRGFVGENALLNTIKMSLQICEEKIKRTNSYTVAVLVTQAKFLDYGQTIEYIAKAWNKPLSIIIVGAGIKDEEDSYHLRALANEDQYYKANGKNSKKRIPQPRQFVTFIDYTRELENQSNWNDILFGSIPNQVSAWEALSNLL